MVANLENTVRKWRAVYNALGRSSKISMRGGAFVLSKNAPALNQMFKNYEQAHARITEAYNKLPNVNNQLNKVAHKIIAARKIQKISRSAVQKRNKKEKNNTMRSALLVARTLPRNMARREILGKIYHNLHVSKTAYGPKTEINASRNYRTYSKYPTY